MDSASRYCSSSFAKSRDISTGTSSKRPLTPAKRHNLLFHPQRLVLVLLQQLHHALTAGELCLRGRVELAAELGKGRHLAILRQIQTQTPGHLLHAADLRVASDTRHRQTDVDGRTHTRIEQVRLKVDLPIGNRDDIGRNIGRHVARLGLDDRQRRE